MMNYCDVSFSPEGFYSIKHLIVLMVMVYHSERSKAQSVKRKGIWGKIWREQGTSVQSPLPGESHRMNLILAARVSMTHVKCCQLSSFETHCSGFLLGADIVGILCLASTKILDSHTKSLSGSAYHKLLFL